MIFKEYLIMNKTEIMRRATGTNELGVFKWSEVESLASDETPMAWCCAVKKART